MIDHRSYTHNLSSYEIKTWNNSCLNGIRTHDLGAPGALFYPMSYQANGELVTFVKLAQQEWDLNLLDHVKYDNWRQLKWQKDGICIEIMTEILGLYELAI